MLNGREPSRVTSFSSAYVWLFDQCWSMRGSMVAWSNVVVGEGVVGGGREVLVLKDDANGRDANAAGDGSGGRSNERSMVRRGEGDVDVELKRQRDL